MLKRKSYLLCGFAGWFLTRLCPYIQSPKTNLDTSPKSEPALEQISRAAPSVETYHRSVGPDTGRHSGGRQIKKARLIVYLVKFLTSTMLISLEFASGPSLISKVAPSFRAEKIS